MNKSPQFKYAEGWHTRSRLTRQIQPLCTNNPFHGRATIVHHLYYRRSLIRRILGIFFLHFPHASISGCEIPGIDIVPVCDRCHQNFYGRSGERCSVHHPSVWKQKGGINNRQVELKVWELRIKFWLLVIGRICKNAITRNRQSKTRR
ncbi:hypothetical protein [Anabaena azotica]|uniref:Uncharacterized protein n=1 Tax=Anabaena azotica FACHB-119 TaxID=947527 RepID=A0ABR8DFM9_9NOST|nr:hypothetical protein [Anabaena azotica]MBD2505333.1 hypothetical protein [Anabaena azotica FACHB-119]